MFLSDKFRFSLVPRLPFTVLALCLTLPIFSLAQSGSKSSVKKTSAVRRGMTEADVEKSWAQGDDLLLSSQLTTRGLAFPVEEDWINQLQQKTGVKADHMPKSAAFLKSKIEESDVAGVSAAAPALLDRVKDAAQKRDVNQLTTLLHPELLKTKAKVYDLFDNTNYRAHSLGRYSSEANQEVSVQFFQLTTSGVERIHYVYFSTMHGKVVVRDVKSGPEEAQRFLRDEQALAESKLQLMFRALNDGDDAGVRTLCTDGLYKAIKDWGGDKHPGDRLTRGHSLDQVVVKTFVATDQKSVRVVADISYPLTNNKKLEFQADFERIGNDLKIVRVRDTENKLVVFDPDMDNYLNRRYGQPDAPPPDVTMTTNVNLISIEQIRKYVLAAIEDHNVARVQEYGQTLIDSNPTGGEGYGIKAAADQMAGHFEDAEKDGQRAVQLGATAYFVVEWHSTGMLDMSAQFTPAVISVSKQKIEYLPPLSSGRPSVDFSCDTARNCEIPEDGRFKKGVPFLRLTHIEEEGKRKAKEFDFAATGTTCPDPAAKQTANLIPWSKGDFCGSGMAPGGSALGAALNLGRQNPNFIPLYVPRTWRQDLMAVWRTINAAQNPSGK